MISAPPPTLEYRPLTGKAQATVGMATARMNIWEGSVRSSKTIASIIVWLIFTRTGPAGNLLMVGKTERTLKRNVIDPIIRMLGPSRARYVEGAGEFWILGRRVYVAGANDEIAQEKIRGMSLVGAYVDEISIIPESFWNMLGTRLSEPGARLFGTTNPDNPEHWFKKVLNEANFWLHADSTVTRNADGRDMARFSFILDDNPFLSDDYKNALKKEYSGLWYRRFILGEWAIAEGAIFDMFDHDLHVVDQLPRLSKCLGIGIDHGTRNPFAAIGIHVGTTDNEDGSETHRLYAVPEYRYDSKTAGRQLTNVEYSNRLRGWIRDNKLHPERIWVDPSAADFRQQLFVDQFEGVTAANNEVSPGIQTIASLLTADRLKIHSSCTSLLEELPGYVWDTKAAAKGEDKPVKLNDHSIDALRYGTHSSQWMWGYMITHPGGDQLATTS